MGWQKITTPLRRLLFRKNFVIVNFLLVHEVYVV